MEPIAVDVILYGGYPQHFMQGRAWRIDGITDSGQLEVLDANGQVIANVAAGRWEAVGYRYTPVETTASLSLQPSRRSWRAFKRGVLARMS
jgi:hypothetical protein